MGALPGAQRCARSTHWHPHAPPGLEPAGIFGRQLPIHLHSCRFCKRLANFVDLPRHIITLDGILLELSPTEFKLLTYLASESPRVVSPQELVREVQGYENNPWEARDLARFHIYRIRRKIAQATGHDNLIHTVHGVGYTLKE